MKESEAKTKALKLEHKSLKEKYQIKCLEFKHLKTELDDLDKEKNSLSVALKLSKKRNKNGRKSLIKRKLGMRRKFQS